MRAQCARAFIAFGALVSASVMRKPALAEQIKPKARSPNAREIMKLRIELIELKLMLQELDQAAAGKNQTTQPADSDSQPLLLHDHVLDYCRSRGGGADVLVERLIELARLQVIELGEPEAGLRCIDLAMKICPPESKKGLQERLWMEGIAAFYTGDWTRGARHFEIEMGVNGSDVEVPVWRWLCDAHNPNFGAQVACERLLPLKGSGDPRSPFPEIYRMFKGDGIAAEVLAAVERDGTADAVMWGHFYIGLHLEALGQHTSARSHFEQAAASGSQNNIAQLCRAHLRRIKVEQARKEWADLEKQASALQTPQ